jgi:hypothetical protein
MKARGRTVAYALLLAYSVVHFASVIGYACRIQGADLISAFPGPLMFRVTEIWPALAKNWIGGDPAWNYGPALHLLTLPFVFASSRLQATRVILVCDYLLMVVTFLLWMRLLLPERRYVPGWIAILCVWLNYFPLLEAVTGRELEVVELFLITLAVWALRRQREALAGVAIGVASMIKFLPAMFIPYLFVKWCRKGASVAGLTALAFAIFGQLALGWEQSVTLLMANLQQTARLLEPPMRIRR